MKASEKEDTLRMYFHINTSVVDTLYFKNKNISNSTAQLFSDSNISQIDSLTISGWASPDGQLLKNKLLAQQRANSFYDYLITKYPSIITIPHKLSSNVFTWDNSDDWSAIADDSIFNIIDTKFNVLDTNKTEWQTIIKSKYKSVYDRLAEILFPNMRFAELIVFYSHNNNFLVSSDKIPQVLLEQSISYDEQSLSNCIDSVAIFANVPKCQNSRLRLTTNLLYWAALSWNFGLEYGFNDHYSIMSEASCAWWSNIHKNKVYRWTDIELKVLWHIKSPRSGWGFGLFGQIGEYEFMFGKRNNKGEFYSAGVLGGYRWKLKEFLSLKAELALGYMRVNYRYADKINGLLMWQGRGRANYFGPTAASIAFVYFL